MTGKLTSAQQDLNSPATSEPVIQQVCTDADLNCVLTGVLQHLLTCEALHRDSAASSPNRHISSYRSDSRQDTKHSSSMQAENQRLKDELQRVHAEIAQHMQGLQKD